ncbi:MAG: VCBS repeat-containing protein [Deltaproteobacteria bacterium]|nr:VCBS repeat-containing protein [Deltaproteobacteria bacterium]
MSGSQTGTLRYYWHVGSLGEPDFQADLPHQGPFSGFALGAETKPASGDIDRDGDLDLLIGAVDGRFHYLENTGDAASPAFVERSGPANPMDGIDIGSHSAPALVDLNRDGQLDVVAGDASGAIRTFYLPEPALSTSLAAGSLLLGLGLRIDRSLRRTIGLGAARTSD